jgi:hypothetical protein
MILLVRARVINQRIIIIIIINENQRCVLTKREKAIFHRKFFLKSAFLSEDGSARGAHSRGGQVQDDCL